MKGILTLIGLLTVLQSIDQTDQVLLTTVQREAKKMSEAFHKGDYETFMDLTHPKTIEMLGSREKMKKLLEGGMGPGIEFVSTEIAQAKKLFKNGETYQCAMKQKQVMKFDGKPFLITGWLIGISYDAGASWSFISVSNNTLSTMQQYFPELDDKLPVKPQKEPKAINN
jgi:hypothetical protein